MINRCDKCGGLIRGRHHGFEAVCLCYENRKYKKAVTKAKEPKPRDPDAEYVAEIVKGVVGVEIE